MSENVRVLYHREFLNTLEAGGHAFVETQIDTWREESLDASFSVADCNRMVSIDCSVYGVESAKNVQEKVKRLRNALATFEAELLLRIAMLKPEKPKTEEAPPAEPVIEGAGGSRS